jgi:hypothetical protein
MVQPEIQWFFIGLGTGLFVLLVVLRLTWTMPIKHPRPILRNLLYDAMMCAEAEKLKLDCSPDLAPLKQWKYRLDQFVAAIYWFFALLGKKHENTTL